MNKRLNLPLFVLLYGVCLFTISCNKNGDDNKLKNCDQSEFSFKLSGESWIGESFENTLAFEPDPVTGVDVLRCDIRVNKANGDQIILTFVNPNATDDSCVETGDYIQARDGTIANDNLFFLTRLGSGNFPSFYADLGTLSITNCNSGDLREISGTFTFKDSFEDVSGTEGQFRVCIPN